MEDFSRQFGVLRRWLPLIVAFALSLAVAVYLVTSSQTEVFEARGELIVQPGLSPDSDDMVVAEALASQFADVSRTRDVSQAVITQLGLDDSVLEFQGRRSVTSELGSNIIGVTARSEDPEEAAAIVEALMAAVVANSTIDSERESTDVVDSYLSTIRVEISRTQAALDALLGQSPLTVAQEAQVVDLEERLATLQRNYAELLPFSSDFARHQVVALEQPVIPDDSVEPRPLFWTMLTVTVALLLGAAFAFVYEFLRGRIRDARDLEAATDLPVFGTIVEHRADVRGGPAQRVVVARLPRSSAAESVRRARSRLTSATGDVASLLVTTCDPGTAGGSVAANLAVAYAESGAGVLLIEGNLREPSIHEYFGIADERGVASLIDYDLKSVVQYAQLVRPGLRVLTAGKPSANPAEAIASPGFRKLLQRAVAEADIVIVTGPVLPAYSDSLTIAGLTQAALLVVDTGTPIKVAREVADSLASSPRVNLAGSVLRAYSRRDHPRSDRRPEPEKSTASSGTSSWRPQPSTSSSSQPAPEPSQPGPYAIGGPREQADRS